MGEKKFWSAKKIMIIILSCILIGASATGVAIFLKDRGQAEAFADGNQIENLPGTGNDEANVPGENAGGGENGEVIEPQTPGTSGNSSSSSETSSGGFGIGGAEGEDILAGITETTVTQERKVFEDLKLSWTTIEIPTITTNMGIYKPQLKIEKKATGIVRVGTTDIIQLAENTEIPEVNPEDQVIYTIKVANLGNYKATNISIKETLDVTFNNKEVKAGENLVTIEILEPGKQATLKVAYKVKQEDIENRENIYNLAYATDGKNEIEAFDDDIPVAPEKIEISGSKTWDDNANQDGIRPESITINLLANGDKIDSKTVTANDNWEWTFANLLKYNENEEEIIYTIEEEQIAGYTADITGYDIINTHEPETIEISGTKIWDDNDNQDNIRPESITINLLADGEVIGTKTVEPDTEGNWKWTFENQPKYKEGKEIVYTMEEEEIPGYQAIYSEDTLTITNIYKNAKTSVTVTKIWDTPHVTNHPDMTVNLYQNGDKTTPFRTATLSAGNDQMWQQEELSYTWSDLPKYKLDSNGDLILTNGEPELNVYTVEEIGELIQYNTTYEGGVMELSLDAEVSGDTIITNQAKGIVETVSYLTQETTYTKPVDVVLVLDTSGSMAEKNSAGNSKAKDMVKAVNETIATVMSHNSNSKIAIVTYSNKAATLLPLAHYTPNSEGQYLTCSQGSYNSSSGKYSNISISTNVQELANQNKVTVTGSTYIQGGIALGTSILTSAETKFDPDGAEGPEPETTRIPIILLLSDGEPTKYTSNYNNVNVTNPTGGNGSSSTYTEAYYTIRTAKYYKAQIEAHYGEANLYTIGYGVDTLLIRTVLNPDKANIDECNLSGKNSNTKKLYNQLANTTEGVYGFNYADGSYTSGTMSSTELAILLNKFIHSSVPTTTYRIFTKDEITAKKVYLSNIDITDGFSLKYGETTYVEISDAITDGVVVQEGTNYYVDLDKIWTNAGTTEQVYVKYHEKKNI